MTDNKPLGWYNMDIAPKTGSYGGGPRVLLLRPDGSVAFGSYSEDKYASKPRPYWTDDRTHLGIRYMRGNTPIGWIPEYELANLSRGKR